VRTLSAVTSDPPKAEQVTSKPRSARPFCSSLVTRHCPSVPSRALPPIGNWESRQLLCLPSPCPEGLNFQTTKVYHHPNPILKLFHAGSRVLTWLRRADVFPVGRYRRMPNKRWRGERRQVAHRGSADLSFRSAAFCCQLGTNRRPPKQVCATGSFSSRIR